MVVGGLAPLFCCVDGFIISRLYFLCHNFPKVSELNSKSYLLSGGIPIPNESDLNSDAYKIPGSYYCHNSNNAKTLINCPFESAFLLKVSYGTGLSFPVQSFTEFRTRKIAERYYDADLAKWSEFFYFSDDATLKSNNVNLA